MPDFEREVVIVDTGGANLSSVRFAFERLQASCRVSRDASEIRSASHVVLPGVGAAGDAMNTINNSRLADTLRELEQPVLGICLGMHLMARSSQEDQIDCLNIFDHDVEQIPKREQLPVPHMGWNQVELTTSHPLLKNISQHTYFYFVHSFAMAPVEQTLGTTRYGDNYSAIIARDNFLATQFHPERSAVAGQQLLKNFLELH